MRSQNKASNFKKSIRMLMIQINYLWRLKMLVKRSIMKQNKAIMKLYKRTLIVFNQMSREKENCLESKENNMLKT